MRAQEIAALHPRFVDGSIIGSAAEQPTLYLSGDEAATVAALFTLATTRVVVGRVGA